MKAPDFATASREALTYLHARLGLGLWMITRAGADEWIVLSLEDHAYDLESRIARGLALRWADTLCARMVRGEGPRAAPRVADVPAYAQAPLGRRLEIGAYMGAPLVDAQGQVFGALCGFDPRPQPESLADELPLVQVLADMLSGLLGAELQAGALAREAEAARADALVDPITGLSNRRAWEQALASEEERCRRYGAPACVVAVEIESPADEDADEDTQLAARMARLLHAAQALRQIVRRPDTLARVDDARFDVLGVECNTAEAMALLRRLEQGLHAAAVPAALGMAMRGRSEHLDETARRAADAMEEHGRARACDRQTLRARERSS